MLEKESKVTKKGATWFKNDQTEMFLCFGLGRKFRIQSVTKTANLVFNKIL